MPASARRTAFALQLNVAAFVESCGLERCGFLTTTFPDHVTSPRESQRRYNSLLTNVLRPRYGRGLRIYERQLSGRIHHHLLVDVGADIRTGLDFAAATLRDYRSACPRLRAEWAFWREVAPRYGFGRCELLPVRSTAEAVSRYLGKYIAKHIEVREKRDKGFRLVEYFGTARVASTRFAWASPGAALWRQKLAAFVRMLYESDAISKPTCGAMAKRFGPRWAHYWRDQIVTFPVEVQ